MAKKYSQAANNHKALIKYMSSKNGVTVGDVRGEFKITYFPAMAMLKSLVAQGKAFRIQEGAGKALTFYLNGQKAVVVTVPELPPAVAEPEPTQLDEKADSDVLGLKELFNDPVIQEKLVLAIDRYTQPACKVILEGLLTIFQDRAKASIEKQLPEMISAGLIGVLPSIIDEIKPPVLPAVRKAGTLTVSKGE